jgi:hypothetical protein
MDAITLLLIPLGFALVLALLITAIAGSLRRSTTGRRQLAEARAREDIELSSRADTSDS